MPIRTDYTVVSNEDDVSPVTVIRTRDESGDSLIILDQDGAEISVTVDMARDLTSVLANLLDG